MLRGAPAGETIFDIVFVVVIVGTLVQGSTTVALARWFGLAQSSPPEPPVTLELGGDAPEDASMHELWVSDTAPAVGRTLVDLALDDRAILTAVVRDGRLLVPRGGLTVHPGDHLFVLTTDGAEVPAAFLPGPERTPVPAEAG